MRIVELRPSMFPDRDSYEEAVAFHYARAAEDPEIKVVELEDIGKAASLGHTDDGYRGDIFYTDDGARS